ncbi:hypothetical protein GQ57_09055 [Burkholderia sp. MSh2]|nr:MULTISPECIES: hypothetical protein [Burkholderia]KEZ06205.1 hypothetical protein GQ57_09055 [Burkholderia sp. MSh2]
MTPTSLVPVEGALGRPRAAPFDHMPPFGREWIFRGAPGARPGKRCLATLATSCIDFDTPHRACHWRPLPIVSPAAAPADAPAVLPAAAVRRTRRAAGGARHRRAWYAICWSVGALGIIGWLIAAYERPAGFEPAYASEMAGVAPDRATSSSSIVRTAEVRPDASTSASPQRRMPAPVATAAEPAPPARHVARRPASPRPQATPGVPPASVEASPPSYGQRTAAARHPAEPRLAARPPTRSAAADTGKRDQLVAPPPATGHARDTLDDPLTLIAMANALRNIEPARATPASADGFDWTSQLSHRRLTDTPDAFAR